MYYDTCVTPMMEVNSHTDCRQFQLSQMPKLNKAITTRKSKRKPVVYAFQRRTNNRQIK